MAKREQCPDCEQCQLCSESRCRLCRRGGHPQPSALGGSFTYGEYLKWRKGRAADSNRCAAAGGCRPAEERMSGRALKQRVLGILESEEPEEAARQLTRLPVRRVANPLLALLHHRLPRIRWAAVIGLGRVTAVLAEEDLEAARVIVRRLMWNLNDESGGIGWGSPEAMGEILCRCPPLAEEFGRVLLSYARKDGNFLEYEALQRGMLWAIGRLAEVHPGRVRPTLPQLRAYLRSPDAGVRGQAARLMGLLADREACEELERLRGETTEIEFYRDGRVVLCRVGELATESLARIAGRSGKEEACAGDNS